MCSIYDTSDPSENEVCSYSPHPHRSILCRIAYNKLSVAEIGRLEVGLLHSASNSLQSRHVKLNLPKYHRIHRQPSQIQPFSSVRKATVVSWWSLSPYMQTKSMSFHQHAQKDEHCISSRPEISESTNIGIITIHKASLVRYNALQYNSVMLTCYVDNTL